MKVRVMRMLGLGMAAVALAAMMFCASQPTVRELLEALQARPDVRVAIEGHTDVTAKDAYNLELSSRRASAVVAWLVKHGIAQARLEAKGYGRTRPVADNAITQGRALNRRVEASIIE